MRLLASLCPVAALLVACSPSTHSPTSHAATATPTPAPTPTPLPDVHQVDITGTGVGAFDLVAVPVAVLHSDATRDRATGVVVHFTTKLYGHPQFSLDSEAVELFAGQTLIVTANCTDTCEGANGVAATVTVTSWTTATGGPVTVGPATYTCGAGCRGSGYGDTTATVSGAGLSASTAIHLFAACRKADGTIVGGGQRAVIWASAGADEKLDVPVILSAQPATCTINATRASSTAGPSPASASSPGSSTSPPDSAAPKPTVPAG